MNTTPLRLVAIEESAPEEEKQSGAPVAMIRDQDAVTRKVPESAMIASASHPPEKPERTASLKIPLVAGGITLAILGAVFALVMREKGPATPAPASATIVPVPSPESPPQPVAAEPAQQAKAPPEVIRLGVTAEPMETELSLDGNVLAGHRLNLEVPKDRGIHVVSASAPGYIPFNQQVTFSSDVVLKISLRRAQMPVVRQVAKPRPSLVEARPKNTTKPAAASPGSVLAPGMNLDGPSVRHNAKPIDERNPYQP